MWVYKSSDDQHSENTGSNGAGGVLKNAAPSNSAPLHEAKPNDDQCGNRGDVASERGHEIAEILAGQQADESSCAAEREPVRPANDKANVISVGAPSDGAGSAGARNHCGDL